MTRRCAWTVLLAPTLLALAGCYEEVTPAYYEPGEYKGEQDPLLNKLERRELQTDLEQRFDRAAQDR